MTDLGFDRPLYILPFDHRGSFQSGLFGWKGALSQEQTERVAASKAIIYDGLLAAVAGGVPKERAGLLVDEQFGAAILRDARAQGFLTAAPAEKSGQHEFDFEYGDDYARHIEAFSPTFCKVLVRYNPEGDAAMNHRQAARLRHLSEYLHRTERKFMFELLVPAEKAELEELHGDQRAYDRSRRPRRRRLHRSRAGRGRGEGRVLAVDGCARPRIHRVRRRTDDLLGRARPLARRSHDG